MIDYSSAIDEIFTLFNEAWASGADEIIGYTPDILWPGLANGVPDNSKFWVRISKQQVGSNQGTLSESVVQNGSKRFNSFGLIFVQIFAPKRNDSPILADKLANFTQNIFRSKTDNVTLRNSRIQELPLEDGAIRINVVVEFEFDEIK